MFEFEFKVETEEFEDWLYKVHNRFLSMVQTLIDIHYLIYANTNQRVPLDTGRLEESFRYDITRQDEMFIEIHNIYSAVDPKYGFDYAEYQHNLVGRGKGTYSRYTRANSWYYSVGTTNHHRHGTRGESFYLLKGVQASESMMWTIIEQDYLSLFYGGIN